MNQPVYWLNDKLPELSQVFSLQTKFDLILLSAVWMHIPPSNRERCIRKLSSLLKANGKIVISLRHGACDDERTMYPVSADELADFARKFGLSFKLLSEQNNADELGRQDVYWQTVTLTLPDDGSGAFPLLRNIIVNDNKSSTYKVALLRTLLRIAEGHPGAVLEQTREHVVLPLGLGFVKETGRNQLSSFSANDFYIGAMYLRSEVADAVYRTLKDVASTIKEMPVRYTTLPGSAKGVFHSETQRTKKSLGSLTLDADCLASFGKFYVPIAIWDSLTRLSFWIEPSLVNEWAVLMERYTTGTALRITRSDFLQALTWEDPRRTTTRIRVRVEQLLASDVVHCCWSRKQLNVNNYAVDHAMPFSRWPNNDLWNLLPTKTQVNATQSDKLPSSLRMVNSKDVIQGWWQQAWSESPDEFFIQANLSLPNLPASNRSFDDVFEAMVMQRDRIKDFQQLEEW